MAENKNSEISELLDKLREKTVAEAAETAQKQKKQTKKQTMTDDDVKNLLRKYFDDIEPAKDGGETDTAKKNEPINLYDLDTSDFISDEEAEEAVEEETEETVEEEIEETIEEEVEETVEEEIEEAVEEETEETVEEETEETVEEEVEETVEEEIEDITGLEETDELCELDELEESDDTGELYEVDSFEDEAFPEEDTEDEIPDDDIIYDYSHKEESDFAVDIEEISEESGAESEESADADMQNDADDSREAPEFFEDIVEESEETESSPVGDINYDNVRDSDIDVMVALGFGDKIKEKFGDERIMRAARNIKKNSEKIESERAFGYIGEEYTSADQNEAVKRSFDTDKQRLTARLCVTAAMSLLLFIYENAPLLGIRLGGIFDMYTYPAAYAMISLQLLVLCALPSWRNLYDGLLGALNQKPTARTLICASLAIMAVYDLLIAIVSPTDGVILFGFPISLGLVFSVLAEYLDYLRERRAFTLISSNDEKYVFADIGITSDGKVILSAEKTSFISGYFERSGKHEQNISFMIFAIVPLLAVGIILSVISAAMGQGASQALGAFAGAIAFGVPLTQIVGMAWAEFGMALSLRADKSTAIGNSVEDEYSDAGIAVFDDSFAFPKGSASVSAIKIYNNNEIYKTLYNISALFSVAGGPLKEVFLEAASELGAPQRVELCEYGTDFISVKVDGMSEVCAGSEDAFNIRKIAVPSKAKAPAQNSNSMIYVAVNGRLCASIASKYEFSKEFINTYKTLSEEGISIRLRSLDPNINEALTEKLCAGGDRPEVSKEPLHTATAERMDAGIVSLNGVSGLIKPLVLRRRVRSAMKIFSNVRYIATAACTVFGAVLMLCSMTVGLSALAGLCQLICFGITVAAFGMIGKNNMKL